MALKVVQSNGVAAGKPDGYYGVLNDRVAKLIPPEAKRILDVGCGAGALGIHMMAQAGDREMTGIELVEEAAERARRFYKEVIVGDVERLLPLPFPDGCFDCVVFGDVLEHLDGPEAVLEGVRPVVRADGCVVACLPNVAHWSVVAPLLRGRFDYADAGILDVTHKRFFTPATFSEMAVRAGWRSEGCYCRALECEPALKEALCALGRAFGQKDEWTSLLVTTYQHLHLLRKA